MDNRQGYNRPGNAARGGRNDFLNEGYSKAPRTAAGTAGTGHGGGYKRPQKKQGFPLAIAIIIDVLIAAVILLFFYLSNYVWIGEVETEDLSSSNPRVSQTPIQTANTLPTPTGTGTEPTGSATTEPTQYVDMTVWRNKFADKFTDGEVIKTDNSYKSANVNVSVEKVEKDGVVYFVADIYLADIKYFKTTFGHNKAGQDEFIDDNLSDNNGIIGINGDNCWDNACVLIRNGTYYKRWSATSFDHLVLYNDGTMKAIPGKDVDFASIKAEAPYQVWGFGPMLLDENGKPMTTFNSTVAKYDNPRTAIGYYEPGHYCFVVVDGRQDGYSVGYTMAELSQLMYDLNCKIAFNLDGGGSSQIAFMGEMINRPSTDRQVNDMIYITDSEE